jgi:hypothetical protein
VTSRLGEMVMMMSSKVRPEKLKSESEKYLSPGAVRGAAIGSSDYRYTVSKDIPISRRPYWQTS